MKKLISQEVVWSFLAVPLHLAQDMVDTLVVGSL